MMKRTIIFIMCVLLMASIFVGCGTPKADETTKETTTAKVTTVTERKEVDITYMTWSYADRKASIDSFIAKAKELYKINIDLLNIPTDQYQATTKTRLAANDLPDLLHVHRIATDNTLYGYPLQMDEFLELNDLPSVSEFNQQILESRKFDGKLLYVPIGVNALGCLYNKKVFEDLKLNIPMNYDELIAIFDKIKAAGITPIGGGFRDAWSTQILPFQAIGQFVVTKHGSDETLKGIWDGTIKWSSPEMKKALNIQQEFEAKGYHPENSLGSDVNTASANVANGLAAMLINGNWQYGGITGANESAEIGFFALPLNAKDEKLAINTAANEGICINAASNNLEAAKEALNYYLSSTHQTLLIADTKGISTNTLVVSDNAFANEVAKAINGADIVLSEINYLVNAFKPAELSFSAPNELQGLLTGVPSIEEFVKAKDAEIAKYVK
jgi:raffinose/stachyose/melibiose transport system substrate-binding protein